MACGCCIVTIAVIACWFCSPHSDINQFESLKLWLATAASAPNGDAVFAALFLFVIYLNLIAPWPGLAAGLCGRKWINRTAVAVAIVCVISAYSNVISPAVAHIVQEYVADLAPDENLFAQKTEWIVIELMRKIPAWATILLIPKLIVGVFSIALARRKNIVTWTEIGLCAAFFTISFLTISGLLRVFLRESSIDFTSIAVIVSVLFPFGSLIFSRISIDWNRHR